MGDEESTAQHNKAQHSYTKPTKDIIILHQGVEIISSLLSILHWIGVYGAKFSVFP